VKLMAQELPNSRAGAASAQPRFFQCQERQRRSLGKRATEKAAETTEIFKQSVGALATARRSTRRCPWKLTKL